jgi:hypothetical protein
MKFWTLIPFYLWKNTFRRWFEYPVSPISKMLIPALLGLLAVIVLTLFGEIERELRHQLEKASVYSVYVSEFVAAENAPTILRKSYEDELMWTNRYGEGVVRQLRQPLTSAVWGRSIGVPIYAYASSVEGLDASTRGTDFPVVWLVTEPNVERRLWEGVSITEKRTLARTADVPAWIRKGLSVSSALMAPVEMVEPILNKGFINHMLADLKNADEVQKFVVEVGAYHRADKRQVKIVSALEILKNLKRITELQQIVRTLIVVGCGVILALTLGSIAWLEYRQDSYLLALLKSFGTPSSLLLLHMFMENLLLVLVGITLARVAWNPLYEMAAPRMHLIGLNTAKVPVLPSGDLAIIVLAGFLGVLLAMVPVAIGLRRPPGLILQ